MRAVAQRPPCCSLFFFFNDTATTEIYTLSLHDALPISTACRPRPSRPLRGPASRARARRRRGGRAHRGDRAAPPWRSEEHTSELQSQSNLVCRLLLEKKKTLQSTRKAYAYRPHPAVTAV